MLRKILIIFSLMVICSLFSGYFYHVNRYMSENEEELQCDTIIINFKGAPLQKFITEDELADVIRPYVSGKNINNIDTDLIEKKVSETGVIFHAEAYAVKPSSLIVEVEQRNPIVRIFTEALDCYADSSGYLLPLIEGITLELPILSGKLPVVAQTDVRGVPVSGLDWLRHTITLTEEIRANPYWSEEIEQIWMNEESDLVLYTRSLPERFIFGQVGDRADIREKFDKMAGYYRTIRPVAEKRGVHYDTVSLEYKDQIICK